MYRLFAYIQVIVMGNAGEICHTSSVWGLVGWKKMEMWHGLKSSRSGYSEWCCRLSGYVQYKCGSVKDLLRLVSDQLPRSPNKSLAWLNIPTFASREGFSDRQMFALVKGRIAWAWGGGCHFLFRLVFAFGLQGWHIFGYKKKGFKLKEHEIASKLYASDADVPQQPRCAWVAPSKHAGPTRRTRCKFKRDQTAQQKKLWFAVRDMIKKKSFFWIIR